MSYLWPIHLVVFMVAALVDDMYVVRIVPKETVDGVLESYRKWWI